MNKKQHNKHRILRVVLLILIAVVLIIGLLGYQFYSLSGLGADYANPPKFIQHDFIDLSHITSISKFRSEAGHDFSGGGETCSSMKHYFSPNITSDVAVDGKDANAKVASVQPDGKTDIAIYSPVDGEIMSIENETTQLGKQVMIVPDNAKAYAIRLFHITPDTSLHGAGFLSFGGSHVTAGQQIGVISAKQDVDIAIQTGSTGFDQHFISYFDVMPDSLFASYQARGLAQRSDVIITQAYRAAHPFSCTNDSEQDFNYPANYDESTDYVRLSGYVALKSDTATPETNSSANDVCTVATNKPPGCP